MLRYVFNGIYLLGIGCLFPWLVWEAIRKGKYREGYGEKFLGKVPRLEKKSSKRIWIHAVSVGEVNLAGILLKAWEERFPEREWLISTTSKTGYDLARKKFAGKTVFYAPLDFTWSVREAMERLRPDLLVLVELELWPNLLLEAKKRRVPVAVVNGRLGERSFRNYRKIRVLMKRILEALTVVLVQDKASGEHFRELGVEPEKIILTGSLKYDGAQQNRHAPSVEFLRQLWGIQESDVVFLAGSTQFPEERYALQVWEKRAERFPELRLILVPRHPERFEEVAEMLEKSGHRWDRRSTLGKEGESRILLVDTVGELSSWWGTAHIGFVGGSMGKRGGQNMLEPAAFGVATCFGPNTWNFRDIVQTLLQEDAAVVVQDEAELEAWVEKCLEEPEYRKALGTRGQNLVRSQQGAIPKTLKSLEENVWKG
ncbi:MAG: 3-deoxy-D-manno-octulosonic acid transferase [Planctomycetia bacterium]|nr:3-deoxy-D-manno-octulosonic acid transferase [Planctomycetia bacterium]